MKKFYSLFLIFLMANLSFGQIINEFEPNPVGTDPTDVSIELKGTPSTSFSGYILSIESDPGTSQGLVDRFTAVSGTFDSNGLLVVSIPDLENPSLTLILTSSFSGDNSTDIDTNNDGTADNLTALGNIYDAIGIPDTTGESLYGASLGGADFTYTGDEPGLVFRDGISNAWYAINDPATEVHDINANVIAFSNFDVADPTISTFGSTNPTTSTASNNTNQIEGFTAYPNPTSLGYVNITSKSTSVMDVAVFDLLGKQVLSNKVTSNKLNVSGLNSGIYVMKVTQNDAVSTQKLVIK